MHMDRERETYFSRRAFLTATSATVAGTAVAAAPLALARTAERHPDAELLELGKQWERAATAHDECSDPFSEAEERYLQNIPTPPEALFYKPSDFRLLNAKTSPRCGRHWYGGHIEELRSTPQTRADISRTVKVVVDGHIEERWAQTLDLIAQTRADEIVNTWDSWQAECSKVKKACGLAEIEAEEERLSRAEQAIREAIFAMPAKTIEGALLKARICVWCTGGMSELEIDLERRNPNDDGFAWSVVRDLVKLSTDGNRTRTVSLVTK